MTSIIHFLLVCFLLAVTSPLVTFCVAQPNGGSSDSPPSTSAPPSPSPLQQPFAETPSPLPLPTNVPTLPAFRAPQCRTFRANLRSHTDLTHFDRRHARRLAIAAIVLSWTGIPALPLSIAALWLSHRIDTPARDDMLDAGVTPENFEIVNRLCAILLGTTEVEDPSFAGADRAAIAMAAVALSIALVVIIVQMCYTFVACCAPRYDDLKENDPMYDDNHSADDQEDDEDLFEEDIVQNERVVP